jgi:hypothetical protein
MTKSTITREQAELRAFITGFLTDPARDKQSANSLTAKVFRIALAAMDGEPVGYVSESALLCLSLGEHNVITGRPERNADDERYYDIIPLYRHAPPAPVVVPDGLRLALSNAGIAAPESDEMLAATCEKQIQALVTWVKDRKPFQPAPVVLDFKKLALELVGNLVDCGGLDEGVKERYLEWAEKTCRAAMLQAGNSPVIDDGRADFEEWMLKGWGRQRHQYDFAMAKFINGEDYADSYTRLMWKAWSASRAVMRAAAPKSEVSDGR